MQFFNVEHILGINSFREKSRDPSFRARRTSVLSLFPPHIYFNPNCCGENRLHRKTLSTLRLLAELSDLITESNRL